MADPAWLERPLPDNLNAALRSTPRSGWSILYPIEFSIVDAATQEYLPTLEQGLADDIQREQLTTGSVRYTIADKSLGPLGAVRLRKVSNEQTEVAIDPPPLPARRPPTDEERAAVQAQPDKHAQSQAMREIDSRRRAEQTAHHRWRQAMQAAVVLGFLDRFLKEQEWLRKTAKEEQPTISAAAPHFRFEEDRWLWEEVNLRGRPLREAWPEWKQKVRSRPLGSARKIADEHESYYASAKKIVQKGRKGKLEKVPRNF